MKYKIISRTLILFTALLVISYVASAQDDLSDGEILNVPGFEEQPVNIVENVNGIGLSLTTLFASNNGLTGMDAGIFFDMENVSTQTFIILSWDININCNSPTADVSVYTRLGTSQGFENTMDGWTLIGSEIGIICVPTDSPTPLGVGGFTIQPGETIGIAMVFDSEGDQWRYTNGTGSNQIYNNGDLEIRTGSSYEPSFESPGSKFSPRVWNGTVFYVPESRPIPTLSEWGFITMAGVLGIIGLLAIRRRKITA